MNPRNDDFLFAQEAQRRGYVSEEQVDEAFRLQKRMAEDLEIDERIGVILVKRGWLGEEQARRVQGRLEPDRERDDIEGYRFVEKIGHGAMGTVYKAVHLGLQRPVAIKILRRDLARDQVQVERLKEEAKLLASLDHPNIVRALDAGESRGFPFVVMEYVEGETLKDRIARTGPLHEIDALRIARGIADALERARRMGVVHRDVKPGNIICTAKDDEPKLMDLGLAKGPVDLGLTQHGATVGTPQYISPEQAQDPRKADIRSDIYSLGATLYALVTGRPPFQGTTLAEILTKVLYEAPPPPRVLNKKVSPEVGYLIERMMLKDPALRYRTPADVVHDIDEILAGRSIIPEGFTGNWEAYLLRQKIRRWTKIAAIAATVCLVIGVAAWAHVRNEERKAHMARGRVIVAETIFDTQPFKIDSSLEVQEKLVRARGTRDQWVDDEPARFGELDRQVRRLERESQWFRDLRLAEKTINEMMGAKKFAQAVTRLERMKGKIPGHEDSPAAAAIHDLIVTVQAKSVEAWQSLWAAHFGDPAPHLEELLARHVAYGDALCTGLFQSDEVRGAQDTADRARTALDSVVRSVTAYEQEFSREAIAGDLAELRLRDLLDRQQDQRRQVESRARRAWAPLDKLGWEITWTGELRPLVTLRLDKAEDHLRRYIEAFAVEEIDAARAMFAENDTEGALLRLNQLARAASDAGLGGTAERARQVRDDLQRRVGREIEKNSARYGVFEDELWTLVQAGDPEGIRKLVQGTLRDVGIRWAFRQEVEDSLGLAGAWDDLYRLAFNGWFARSQRGDPVEHVQLREGEPDRRWIMKAGTDPATLTPVVSLMRGEPGRERSLREVHPEQLQRWAEESQRLPPMARAVVALASVDDKNADLRPRMKALDVAARAFDKAGYKGGLGKRTRMRAADTWVDQDSRETQARKMFEDAKHYFTKLENFDGAIWRLGRFVSPTSVLRLTDFFDRFEEEIKAYYEEVVKHVANAELASSFPGARLTLDGERTRMKFDFNDADQLESFRHGEALATGIREPHAGSASITPRGGGQDYRFHLLRGMTGLVRDCPFALPCIFDPAEPIQVQFDLHTLDSPFLLIVDIDGLQVAVLSANPIGDAYRGRWALPEDVPLLTPEEKRPTVGFYGRGRGVAFHAGKGFGDPRTWDWPQSGRGRKHEAWTERTREMGQSLGKELFAFAPRAVHRVRVLREQGRLTLFVDGREVDSRARREWARVGRTSDRDRHIRARGSGLIQISTWTPQAIDNLALDGVVLDNYRGK